MITKNTILTSSLVVLVALGLTGCSNNTLAPNSKKEQVASSNVAKKVSINSHAKRTTTSHQDTNSTPSSNRTTHSSTATSSASLQSKSATNTSQVSSSTKPVTSSASKDYSTTSSQTLASFINQKDIKPNSNQYVVTPQEHSTYQIEVRNNQGGDPNVSHLTDTYQYNPTTQQIQQLNPITGEFE